MHSFKKRGWGPYPSAEESAFIAKKEGDTPQHQSSTYRLAFQDFDFLLREELRPVRIQLEMLKPELIMDEQNVESTVAIFGSSRILEPRIAQKELDEIRAQKEKNPNDSSVSQKLKLVQRNLENSKFYEEARKLSQLITKNTSENKMLVITGGGPGIMEAANRGAVEVGGRSIGLNIVIPHEQEPNRYITPELCFQFHYFATRKMHFLTKAKGLVAFPGGLGTLDELFETLTLLQTKKIKEIPVILFSRKYWNSIVNFEALVQEGSISEQDLDLFQYVESAEEAWEIIASYNNLF